MLQRARVTGFPTHTFIKPFISIYCKDRAKLISQDEKI